MYMFMTVYIDDQHRKGIKNILTYLPLIPQQLSNQYTSQAVSNKIISFKNCIYNVPSIYW